MYRFNIEQVYNILIEIEFDTVSNHTVERGPFCEEIYGSCFVFFAYFGSGFLGQPKLSDFKVKGAGNPHPMA